MKRGVVSILIAISGFYAAYRFNMMLYNYMIDATTDQNKDQIITPNVLTFHKLYKIILLSIALLSLYLGIITTLKKNKIGIIGIVLSLLLIVTTFIPFCMYLIEK